MRFLLLLVAAVIAIFAGVAALQLSSKNAGTAVATAQPAQSQPVSTVDVLVARDPIPAGTVITQNMFDKQPWPENLVLEGFIVNNGPNANIVGKVTRSAFQAREPLLVSKLANINDSGFLAASLPPGMRAITIATDAVSGVAGFVFPGDRIDVVFTHNIPQELKSTTDTSPDGKAAAATDRPGYAEVLAPNIPVLAVNLRDNAKEESAVPNPANALSSTTPSSMTLQVSDVQAEKIRLAERLGTLSISLRSIKDRDNANPIKPADLSSLTQVHLTQAQQQQEEEGLKVVRGSGNESNGSNIIKSPIQPGELR